MGGWFAIESTTSVDLETPSRHKIPTWEVYFFFPQKGAYYHSIG